ncbi:hypothetical protein IFM61606_02610 [Aspergillus udagawae]|uniref:superoxide dismutase n=1 Tax=Aspergillus udagawae TaxID=91492 RepID=A0A8H3P2F2_9EURO|nr:uncharacterized protein Aud_008401 [Aspergillus udagawae]GFF44032.1 hypothetical protein IFM46972_07407 [Aspergillus udagawae]GFF46963.1 hypothetical protein IFM51744_06455 [Aspergillus udagawae]GFF86104.1 hypothetical protein IFM53868_04701 [Aspergillus udagawae]GFG04943.1 hypothetical protein IFM5058_02176 [Aspergillus udagawae]GFG22744.1 hypothetical protein IFM61606_02610 [Aspergillus udagawae]
MQSLLATTLLLLRLSLSSTALAVSPNGTFAPVVTNARADALYEATLPHRQDTTVRGWITLFAPREGDGVKVHADFWGIPDNEALAYSIHEDPVPADGDCYKTGSPFDPYRRGNKTACNMTSPQTCQIGDLSGKHGPIVTADHQGFEAQYNDLYLSTEPGEPAYFGNRSIVVHRMSDQARMSCANFVLVARPGLLPDPRKN